MYITISIETVYLWGNVGNAKTRTRQSPLNSQANRQNSHQRFICHWIYDRADNCLKVPPSCDITVNQIGNASVEEEGEGVKMIIVEDKIAKDGSREKAGEG